MRIWPVGTWQAKSELYAYLRLEGIAEGAEADPHGYCHFSTGCDENYFKQLTAESLVTHQRNGREITEWMVSGENHFLDCRVYNMAAAERLGISRFSVEKWKALAVMREIPEDTIQGDLLSLESQLNHVPKPEAKPEEPKQIPKAGGPQKRRPRRIRTKH